jgi:hypothetical protein
MFLNYLGMLHYLTFLYFTAKSDQLASKEGYAAGEDAK